MYIRQNHEVTTLMGKAVGEKRISKMFLFTDNNFRGNTGSLNFW